MNRDKVPDHLKSGYTCGAFSKRSVKEVKKKMSV
jgi:hypothetical protein